MCNVRMTARGSRVPGVGSLAAALVVALVASPASALKPKDVYKKAGPAVVLILGSDDGKSGSGGTGSIVTPEGKVITNAHVVISEATNQPYKTLYVFLKPPTLTGDNKRDLVNRYTARVLSYSGADELDLAVLQIESPPPNLPTIPFANPDAVEVGDEVIAIGHPEQGGLWTLTTGTVSTLIANFNRVKGKDVFQTEASVNRGNSGGPLLDETGNMVGINTMIARQGAGGVAITGVNFALKSSVAVSWLAGQGMGLAYAAPPAAGKPAAEPEMVVAVAPESHKPAASGEAPAQVVSSSGAVAASAAAQPTGPSATVAQAQPPAKPQVVQEQPVATIIVAEAPPKQPEKLREAGQKLGQEKQAEKLEKGKPFDPAKANPKYVTEKRPYSIDDLRKQQMKDMEEMMDEMRGKVKNKKGKGLGLW